MTRALLAFIVATTSAGVTVIAQHKPAKTTAALAAPIVREPLPPVRRVTHRVSRSHRRQRPHVVPVGAWADTTMYCATGNRNAAGRWPQLGDVAVADRSIRFGARVLIGGDTYTVRDWIGWGSDFDIYGGNGSDCEQRALNYGRRRLQVVVLP